MRVLEGLLLLLLVTMAAAPTMAADVGRYQAILLPQSDTYSPDTVLIIDTKEGHLWTWTQEASIPSVRQGGRFLIYQGKVRPGQKIGDVIEKQLYGQ